MKPYPPRIAVPRTLVASGSMSASAEEMMLFSAAAPPTPIAGCYKPRPGQQDCPGYFYFHSEWRREDDWQSLPATLRQSSGSPTWISG